ncbi:MAG: adenine deaminase [Lachnospiraceae bacterium]|nr:adenine deaminase [Lachnospiraceae bacterium]
MKRLFKNGLVVNVFTDEVERVDVLVENERIIGVGKYEEAEADVIEDVSDKVLCPGFIDGHIHIESTMLTPAELAKVCVKHGTTSIVADPHEIANVCGTMGIAYMLQSSEELPMTVYMMLPSCVPSTPFDETGAVLQAEDLRAFYENERVLGLGEVMNYPGVLAGQQDVLRKIEDAYAYGRIVNGHAPLLSGKALDHYIAAGITDDHECSEPEEAKERIRKGQWVMIRQGTAARNLEALLPLFEEPWSHRCMLVTDDRHPADLIEEGHIDHIIRMAVKAGKSAITAIRMATIQAASYYNLRQVGAIAPGYVADMLILDDLESVKVRDVYRHGVKVVDKGNIISFQDAVVPMEIKGAVENSFHIEELKLSDFSIEPKGKRCRVIQVQASQLLTEERIAELDFEKNNGIDVERDILKLAVAERHHNTGHIGIGFVSGIGMKRGAIASSVSHDSHNLIVIGTNEEDMLLAANRIRNIGGGNVVAADGRILAEMPLPIAGLMSELSAQEVAKQNRAVREAVHTLGVANGVEPFMNMAFISLPVIPALKMTTLGLVNVNTQEMVPVFVDDEQ